MGRHRPARSLAAIQANLAAYSRQPFLETLARFMQCAPTKEAITTFANKSPDKWAAAVRTLGQLYGYADKIDITNNVFVNIHSMSDAELMKQLETMRPVLEVIPLKDVTPPEQNVTPRSGQNSAASDDGHGQEQTEKTP